MSAATASATSGVDCSADCGSCGDGTCGPGEDENSCPSDGGGSNPGFCTGYATRFWDCRKPHCGWTGNVPSGVNPITTCDANDQSYGSNYSVQSACSGGSAHTCHAHAPWAVSNSLSYGFAATANGDICGRCYQLDFTSGRAAGKRMIVQALNTGYDVGGHQFDIMIPGGGVGAFNACSNQWGVSASEPGSSTVDS